MALHMKQACVAGDADYSAGYSAGYSKIKNMHTTLPAVVKPGLSCWPGRCGRRAVSLARC
ncbi:hypothetical protein GCM10023063_29220 [Arthrobacter methylotrophus]